MKNIFLAAFAIIAIATSSIAQSEVRNLKVVMKEMSTEFKTIGAQLDDTSLNISSADRAHHLTSLIIEARAMKPSKIAELPASQQAQAFARYQQQMDGLSALSSKLEASLRANDSQTARLTFDEMVEAKGKGHDDFKG